MFPSANTVSAANRDAQWRVGKSSSESLNTRIAVIGAGIVGITSAYEPNADEHEVSVFERRESVASESSFANAGVIAPGYVTPWAAPGMRSKVISHLLSQHSAV